ncbi:MAG TPA: hypothetical protein ENI43_06075 [Firmicutes bacterium]|nr:hypothetical protein [Bacillota bacterium]
MKKIFVTMVVLCVGLAFGASTNSTSILDSNNAGPMVDLGTLNADNAHWQVYDEGGESCAACVVDGGSQYGSWDRTWMYNTDAFDLSGASEAYAYFDYKLDVHTEGGGDYFSLYIYTGDMSGFVPENETPVVTFDTDQSDWTTYNIDMSSYIGESTVYFVFYWKSDMEGVAAGVRVDNATVGYWDGETWEEIQMWDWNTDKHYTHENWDISDAAGSYGKFGFHYDTGGDTWLWWWVIDNVNIYGDVSGDMVDEDFASDPDWEQEQYSGNGVWEWYSSFSGFYHNFDECYICDSDGHSSWVYDVEVFTPVFDAKDDSVVTLEFDSEYENIGTNNHAIGNLYVADFEEYADPFDNLDGWTTVDEGAATIEDTSLGNIKAIYR